MCFSACAAWAQEHDAHERDHAAARAEYKRSGRTAKGENAADLLHRGYKQKLAMREAALRRRSLYPKAQSESGRAAPESDTSTFANLIWQSLGPSPAVFDPTNLSSYGNVTGRVSAVVVDPSDPTGNTVYIGGASGGVWKSSNAATSDPNAVVWTPLTDDQPSLAIGSIALQPGGGNVLLVGTGEANSSGDSYYGQGILRSTDRGQTWALISAANGGTRSFRGLGFSNIAFSTLNTNLVVAAAASTNAADPGGNGAETQGPNGRGLYYSTDAGLTWTYATVNDPSGPTQAGSVGDVVYNPIHRKFYAAARFHGYYSSTDGATWTRLANQPGGITSAGCPANPVSVGCPIYRGSLSVRENTGEVFTIFVDNSDPAVNEGIFVLAQDGGTWSSLGQTGMDVCGDGDGCGTKQGDYNLYVRAVPNGTNTDVYVGAINIYKCSLPQFGTACGAWLNLTHVYGCSPLAAPSHVHPDQHAIDFSRTSSPTHVYFGNDGGVWRALDETALASGGCTADVNPFQNLNATIGSLSEFVSFSQHPSDPGVLLGGLQDNGSPALVPGNAGANGILWQGLNDGDGGYNAIDPGSPFLFYTSANGVSVQRCAAGTSCNRSMWTDVVSPGTVAGDSAAFYPPWLLDPQNSALLGIGTCRVWRGPAAGGGYGKLSNNFSQGVDTPCSGTNGDTKVRSIAMGGPVTGNGSQVIYAGMFGDAPVNGHIFVTTNADGGVTTWVDRTGSINPSGYDISDIAISPYDTTGRAAYLTIMGFGTGHIYKTADAGASWTDKSANLPDVPANSVVVDPLTPNTVYIGTDVGVFLTSDDGATWAELGTGLPNAPAVKIRAFVSGSVKKLRVATYGRGLWQLDLPQPDINFFSAPLHFTAVVGRSSLSQTATLQNNSSGPVTLASIAAGGDFSASSGCPGVLNSGASCTVTVTFTAHAAGASTNTLTLTSSAPGGNRTLQLNGTGVDFNINALGPRPGRPQRGANGLAVQTLTVRAGQSATLGVGVSAMGAPSSSGWANAERAVRLECSAAGLECSVQPSILDLARTETARVTVSIGATGGFARSRRLSRSRAGSYTLQVRARAGDSVRILQVPVTVQ